MAAAGNIRDPRPGLTPPAPTEASVLPQVCHPRPPEASASAARRGQLLPWSPPVGHGALLGHSQLPALTPREAAARGDSSPWRLRAEPAPVGEGACPRCVIRSSSSAVARLRLCAPAHGPGGAALPSYRGDTEAQQLG